MHLNLLTGAGGLPEATEDATERQKLQMMIPVRHHQEIIIVSRY